MNLSPFIIEVNQQAAPDTAFGAAQQRYRNEFQGDGTTGSILTKEKFVVYDLPTSKVREALIETALHFLHSKDDRTYGKDRPAGYVTDGHGYYIFFGWSEGEA